jgi:hypothetical protein
MKWGIAVSNRVAEAFAHFAYAPNQIVLFELALMLRRSRNGVAIR